MAQCLPDVLGLDESGLSRYVSICEGSSYKDWPTHLLCRAAALLNISLDDIAESIRHQAATRQNLDPPIRVALFRSGDLTFTREITRAFTDRIQSTTVQDGKKSPRRAFRVVCDFAGPANTGHKVGAGGNKRERSWDDIAAMIPKIAPDYIVPVGTQAATALHNWLAAKKQYGEMPFVFLGVTFPCTRKCRLVDSLEDRMDPRNVAGVGYVNIIKLVNTIFDTFKRPLVYFYRKGEYDQDDEAGIRLGQSDMCRKMKQLRILPLDHEPTLADLRDADAIYFSWYTLEHMLDQGRGLDLLEKRHVVSSTLKQMDAFPRCIAAVSVDDAEIGRRGADLIISHAQNPMKNPLGSKDIHTPDVVVRVNRTEAERRSISAVQAAADGLA